jgi:hypothetical protein
VGGDLDLDRLQSINEVFNPTVCRDIYCNLKVNINKKSNEEMTAILNQKLVWQDGKYRKIDGIFCEVLRKLKYGYKVKINNEISYIVEIDGQFAHGKTLKEARESFIYKISDRDTTKYKDMTLDTILTKTEAIQMYRTVTGACEEGTKIFIQNSNITKNKATIGEIIEITKGQYNHNMLVEFFMKEGELC